MSSAQGVYRQSRYRRGTLGLLVTARRCTDTVKKTIRLYDAGLGLVIPTASGVVYSNQTCGNICMQPGAEGVFVPFENVSACDALIAHFEGPKYIGTGAMLGLDEADADFIDQVLTECRQAKILTDRSRLAESHEAWVHVTIQAEFEWSMFSGFGPYPLSAILTWPNSD